MCRYSIAVDAAFSKLQFGDRLTTEPLAKEHYVSRITTLRQGFTDLCLQTGEFLVTKMKADRTARQESEEVRETRDNPSRQLSNPKESELSDN